MTEGDAQLEQKKSRDTSRADTTVGALKKLCFWQNCEEMFNRLNSANELRCTRATCRGHRVKSRAGVTWRGHMQRAYELPRVICIYK